MLNWSKMFKTLMTKGRVLLKRNLFFREGNSFERHSINNNNDPRLTEIQELEDEKEHKRAAH